VTSSTELQAPDAPPARVQSNMFRSAATRSSMLEMAFEACITPALVATRSTEMQPDRPSACMIDTSACNRGGLHSTLLVNHDSFIFYKGLTVPDYIVARHSWTAWKPTCSRTPSKQRSLVSSSRYVQASRICKIAAPSICTPERRLLSNSDRRARTARMCSITSPSSCTPERRSLSKSDHCVRVVRTCSIAAPWVCTAD
jgi:hypothetical protein